MLARLSNFMDQTIDRVFVIIFLVLASLGILFCCVSCSPRPPEGTVVTYYDIDCLKSDVASGVGFTSGGKMVFTSHSYCIWAECIEHRKTYGKRFYNDTVERVGIVNKDNCL